jgi:hypothetical protein
MLTGACKVNIFTPNFKAFLVLLVMAAVLGIASVYAAEAGAPQMLVIVAYANGEPVAAQAVGFAPSLTACQAALEAELGEIQPKPGVTLAAVCTPIPPVPPQAK